MEDFVDSDAASNRRKLLLCKEVTRSGLEPETYGLKVLTRLVDTRMLRASFRMFP